MNESRTATRVDRSQVLAACCALATMSVIVSNIITNKQMSCAGFALPCGALLIPIDYVIGDVVAEVYGFVTARRVIILAFAMNALAACFFLLTLALPGYETFTAQAAFEAVLGTSPRILLASLTAFVAGSLTNARIMHMMHVRDGESRLAWRAIASTVVGESIDMVIFAVLAFGGVLPWDVIGQIIVVDTVAKVAIECALYACATRRVIRWAKTLQ